MSTRSISVCVVLAFTLTLGCRKKASTAVPVPAPVPAPSVADASTPPPAPSVYEAGSSADRKATEKDRQFKRWTAAFVRGTPADKSKARAELAGQPPELRAEFEKFCQANGVKIE